jgi:hypothetical protein
LPRRRGRCAGFCSDRQGFRLVAGFALGTLFVICFVTGLMAGMLGMQNHQAERNVGYMIGFYGGFPLLLISLGLSIWLTVIGKLPGTGKYRR